LERPAMISTRPGRSQAIFVSKRLIYVIQREGCFYEGGGKNN
jgi:hypothetical protein